MTVDPNELEELQGILRNKKSSGNESMNTELLKYMSVEIKKKYLSIINICWTMHKIPNEGTRGVICSLFKKGNIWDCDNYRGISLLNVAYKVYAKIIS
jgi:sorting nexin-29